MVISATPEDAAASIRRATTMKQVAALAGVGTKTVSRVINAEPRVAAETAAKVWEAIRVLDYHVDMRAGSLRRADGRTRTLGLLVSSVDNPFAGEIHRGVEDIARARGVAVLAVSLHEDPAREARAVEDFVRRRLDGIILGTTSTDVSHLSAALTRGMPMVFIDRRPLGLAVDCVTSDNREAAALATRHLIKRGHRRIAFLAERPAIRTAAERHQGFLDAFGEAGIATGEAQIVLGLDGAQAAEQALGALLDSDQPPTAVFSSQNLITIGALKALHSRGLQHRVALISFDDLELADLLDPAVTVIRQDSQGMGRVAAERMFRKLDGDQLGPEHIIVPTQLIERGSGEIAPGAS
ncbi:LacI family DNA-binding transcriptional regulator [Brooklawnia sp.]|uniref:LacI family DNA-binding transcriptional regulator n=1 Tax=Brooklawnia sp. TaxID=2699740 RepID=UPI00311D5381